jgi:hypothetical protein
MDTLQAFLGPMFAAQTADIALSLKSIHEKSEEQSMYVAQSLKSIHENVLTLDARVTLDISTLRHETHVSSAAAALKYQELFAAADLKYQEQYQQSAAASDSKFQHLQAQFDALHASTISDQQASKSLHVQTSQDHQALKSYIDTKVTMVASRPASVPTPPGPKVWSNAAAAPAQTFVPDRIFVRGWSPFNGDRAKRTGLSEEEAEQVMSQIVQGVRLKHPNVTACIDKWSAPYYSNHQVTIFMKSDTPSDRVWDLAKALNEFLKKSTPPVTVQGHPVFATVDNPPWKKDRNSGLSRAAEVFVSVCTLPHELKKDWSSGELWMVAPVRLRLGEWQRKSGSWVWFQSSMDQLQLPWDRLTMETAAKLQD